jgi:hypothetical protein
VQTAAGSEHVMIDSIRALLTEATLQEVTSEQPPTAVLDHLRAAIAKPDSGLTGRVNASAFTVVLTSGPKSTRYPGSASGAVEEATAGSRVVYTVDIPTGIRLVLRVWAAISAVLVVACLVMAAVALAGGALTSMLMSLFPPAVVFVVWRHWTQLQGRSRELNERLRASLAPSSGSTEITGGLHNKKMQQTSHG